MARKKKVSKLVLPSHIELISSTTGRVREFDLSHAQRILDLQRKSGVGSYELYNVELYTLDDNNLISILPKKPTDNGEFTD